MVSVPEWVSNALISAKNTPDVKGQPGIVNRERSKHFVEALGEIARSYVINEAERVLTKHYVHNRSEFGLNELLFDVLWCETRTTKAAEEDVLLRFVSRGKWAVESEFARDSRQALYDFNKLVLADTDCKLFIGPITDNWQAFLKPLAAAAVHAKGLLYVALVPHPSEWNTSREKQVMVFCWTHGVWERE